MASGILQSFELDVNVSGKTKLECLKLLSVVLKNLVSKGSEEKYRQLRLNNPKINRLTSAHPSIENYLQVVANFGRFQGEDGETLLKCPEPHTTEVLERAVKDVQAALARIAAVAGTSAPTSALSEKQKARHIREQAASKQKQDEEAARKRTIAQIAADKHVRENDPNWKPSVSAAAAKAGTSMSTFRDKFGE